MHRRTKIVATLGPATDRDNNLEKIIAAGANVVRLNFSHGSTEDHIERANSVQRKLSVTYESMNDINDFDMILIISVPYIFSYYELAVPYIFPYYELAVKRFAATN